jgi:hypothetical protein
VAQQTIQNNNEIVASAAVSASRLLSRHVVFGALSAATMLLVLSLLGLFICWAQPGGPSVDDGTPDDLGRAVGGWVAFSTLLAFMGGGYTAARSARTRQSEHGVRLGGMVFVIASPLILWVVLESLFGSATTLVVALTIARVSADSVVAALQAADARWLMVLAILLGLTGGAFGGLLAASGRETTRSGAAQATDRAAR